LKISTIFFAFLAAFSPRTMNSRYVNSFFTSSRKKVPEPLKRNGYFDNYPNYETDQQFITARTKITRMIKTININTLSSPEGGSLVLSRLFVESGVMISATMTKIIIVYPTTI
ncbi:hypothetical protein L0Y49_04540, partial [bacterium]|nr:hypothetical protein [bacterium]